MSFQTMERLFTVDEYYQMAQSGILKEDDRVELIEGEIIQMGPIGSSHAGCFYRLNQLFSHGLKNRTICGGQNPLHIDDYTEPQPDFMVLKRDDFYSDTHPRLGDILLLIEISQRSITYDRTIKLPLYGSSGIPECWVVDLDAKVIKQYREPDERGYNIKNILHHDQTISPLHFPDLVLNVLDIIG